MMSASTEPLSRSVDEEACSGEYARAGGAPLRRRRQLATAGLLLFAVGLMAAGACIVAAAIPHRSSTPVSLRPQQAYQANSPAFFGGGGARFVEHPIARLPAIASAQIDVRMLGRDINGAHVVGHLVVLANPLDRVSLALPPGGCGTREKTTITAMAHRPKCKLAVNAGYFNVTDAACIGNVISHGKVIQTVPLEQGNVNFGIKGDKFVIGYLSPEEMAGFNHLVSGVVWLVRDGKNNVERGWAEANITVQTSGKKYATSLASRTAVGWDAAGRLMILQIDGSIAVGVGRGMNMSMLADTLILHGAVQAINLDGGGSSAMARDGVLSNYPSDQLPPSCPDDSKLYQCERPVSTVLCLHEKTA